MDTQKLTLTTLLSAIIRHYIVDGNPPAIAENGKYGLRVHCLKEPTLRFDPIGLAIPDHLLDEKIEDCSISEILDPDNPSFDPDVALFFSEVDSNLLQGLQDFHETVVRSDASKFLVLLKRYLGDLVVAEKLVLPDDLQSFLTPSMPKTQSASPENSEDLSPVERKAQVHKKVKAIQYLSECRNIKPTVAIKFMGASTSTYYAKKDSLEPLTSDEIAAFEAEFADVTLPTPKSKMAKPKAQATKKNRSADKSNVGTNSTSLPTKTTGPVAKTVPPTSPSSLQVEPETSSELETLRRENAKLRSLLLQVIRSQGSETSVENTLLDLLLSE